MMKHIHTIVLLLMLLLPMGSMAQSLEIVEEFKENKMSTVLTTYKNEFGHREKQHVLDNKFPFAVLEVYLEGDEQAVKAAKSKLSLDLGSHFTVEGVCKTYNNRIVFLISSSVRNVYMTCGDGCKEQLIFSGQTLEQNKIYYGRVKYTPAVAIPTPDPVPIKSQFFKFRLTPANASVVIISNGVEERLITKEGGFASKMLKYGSYRYRITADRYYPKEGTFEVSEAQTELSIALHPQFGWLNASGNQSTQGAYVFATSQSTGNTVQLGTIPLTKKEMDAGEYMLHVQKEKYKDYSTALTITPGHTANISVVLEANFAAVSLSAQTGAEIYVDGEHLSTSIWNGTLELGEHTIETRQAGHQTAYTVVDITPQSSGKTISLNNPIPIYGTLIVDGSPVDANIYIDDKKVGTTPLVANDLLIGTHKVRLEKDGYDKQEKSIKIAEGQESILEYNLIKTPPKSNDYSNSNAHSSLSSSDSDNDVIYTVVEHMPEFPGGQNAMMQFITDHLIYPKEAKDYGIQGRVICQFVVEKDGRVSDVQVIRSAGDAALDQEAVRVVSSMPLWNPGTQRGKPVRVKYTIPVNFRLPLF